VFEANVNERTSNVNSQSTIVEKICGLFTVRIFEI